MNELDVDHDSKVGGEHGERWSSILDTCLSPECCGPFFWALYSAPGLSGNEPDYNFVSQVLLNSQQCALIKFVSPVLHKSKFLPYNTITAIILHGYCCNISEESEKLW